MIDAATIASQGYIRATGLPVGSLGYIIPLDEDGEGGLSVPFTNIFLTDGSYIYVAKDLLLDVAGSEIGTSTRDFRASGKDLLVLRNTTGGAINLLLMSTANRYGRFTNPTELSLSIPGNDVRIVGPLELEGWADDEFMITFRASAAGLRLAVVRLPRDGGNP